MAKLCSGCNGGGRADGKVCKPCRGSGQAEAVKEGTQHTPAADAAVKSKKSKSKK